MFDLIKVNRTYKILYLIEPVFREVCIRVSFWSIGMSVKIVWKKFREHRVVETALVVISNVHNCLLDCEKLAKFLEAAPLKRVELRILRVREYILTSTNSEFFWINIALEFRMPAAK